MDERIRALTQNIGRGKYEAAVRTEELAKKLGAATSPLDERDTFGRVIGPTVRGKKPPTPSSSSPRAIRDKVNGFSKH